jgi:hypothetical protein
VVEVMYLFSQKMGWATFWMIFSQTRTDLIWSGSFGRKRQCSERIGDAGDVGDAGDAWQYLSTYVHRQ